MRDAEEEALQEREGGPETRGRALQRSRQLASLYDISTENKFLRSRAKRSALIELELEKAKRSSGMSELCENPRTGSDCVVSSTEKEDESDGSDDEKSSVGRMVFTSPIKAMAGWNSTIDLTSRSPVVSPVKQARPWYNSSPNASLKQQVALGITLDAKLRRYGGRGTAKLVRSAETLEPLSTNHPVVAVDEFVPARELCALNALGSCMLSRTQFMLLITREFPLCDVKYVNRLFSSYDWELRDSLDARLVLGTIRAMRVQQGEPVEIICASLRDFDDSTGVNSGGADDNKSLVSTGVSLAKALSLCCATDDEEKDMATRADAIWTKVLAWQRQVLSKRLNGGSGNAFGTWSNTRSNIPSRAGVTESFENSSRKGGQEAVRDDDGDSRTVDEEDNMEKLTDLVRLVDESRVSSNGIH
ncbi:hypothetical protein BBJ29_004379 [Phytophthora kernoviae]|uniref:Uncharacterized protein n=1 Tax=Phytophthora kernoviae TaxID=325452 RepID=A0A421G1V6_9STRA|nr:hypothetical protein BBJ29_004379 [Phytophthora kernoviae]